MQKRIDFFDLAKYILSIFVVAIHVQLYPLVLYPWLRIAVPVFFMISSYLFFSKCGCREGNEQNQALKVFVTRNLKLYAFWFIVLLPITIELKKGWFTHGVKQALVNTFSNLLLSETFVASWYIVACVEATVLIFFLSRKFSKKTLLAASSAVYLWCIIRSSYYFLFPFAGSMRHFCEIFEYKFANPVFSFPAALIWIVFGKMYADGDIHFSKRRHITIAAVSAVALWIEHKLVTDASGLVGNDCYFFLVPLCFSLFGLMKDVDVHIGHAGTLRKISTITYASHGSLIQAWYIISEKLLPNAGTSKILFFLWVLAVCHMLSFLIFRLEKCRHLAFLKYAH